MHERSGKARAIPPSIQPTSVIVPGTLPLAVLGGGAARWPHAVVDGAADTEGEDGPPEGFGGAAQATTEITRTSTDRRYGLFSAKVIAIPLCRANEISGRSSRSMVFVLPGTRSAARSPLGLA
jgi:hypothetical protein